MPCLPQENQACGEKLLLVDVHLFQGLLSRCQDSDVLVVCMCRNSVQGSISTPGRSW